MDISALQKRLGSALGEKDKQNKTKINSGLDGMKIYFYVKHRRR
jgi:hypothetical protein